MNEAKFQKSVIRKIKLQGDLVQKFNDAFAIGIADIKIAAQGSLPIEPASFELELKWKLWPKMAKTPINPSLTGNQRAWLKKWHNHPSPTGVLMGTDRGWFAVPTPRLALLFEMPSGQIQELITLRTTPPTFSDIVQSYLQVESLDFIN